MTRLAEIDRLVLWVGSASEANSAGEGSTIASFPRDSALGGSLLTYGTSSGVPRALLESLRLPEQPTLLAVWVPPPEIEPSGLVEAFEAHFQAGLGERNAVTHFIASYAHTGRLATTNTSESLAGLMVALTDCSNPSDVDAFQDWYDEVHAPEALAPGIYATARRFLRTSPATPGSGIRAAEFLALYESKQPGAEAFAEIFSAEHRPPSPLHPSCRVRAVWAFDRL
ncbi:MAG: hypothetical protein H6718_14495 [Polyangiaceae bacterium]|nr:hypothetical protein [Myxococcales bacterium]MCB9586606.1 hypothetical protein [Polyangiaceae bacterium]MCB9606113.1 hypothetical protein [Polyangiaceae bacterium]